MMAIFFLWGSEEEKGPEGKASTHFALLMNVTSVVLDWVLLQKIQSLFMNNKNKHKQKMC